MPLDPNNSTRCDCSAQYPMPEHQYSLQNEIDYHINDDGRTVLFMATVSDASQTQAANPTLIWPPSPNTTLS
jgi:hypothetical protein